MIIVNINSQLGNQMFQYAIYRKLLLQGKKVKADLRYYQDRPEQYSLDIFNLHINAADNKEIEKVKDEYRSYFDRFRRKLFGRRKNIISEIDSSSYDFNSNIFGVKRAYIDGYWQSEKYFKNIRNILLNDFHFPDIEDEQNIQILRQIQDCASISIHIRRGDYVNGFPLLTKEYYAKAIQYFQNKYLDAMFFVFSNDMEWAKENIQFRQGFFVDWNVGKNSWKDMFLMTQCKHNIIANSSFSWWGAWLNENEGQEVIVPSIWLYHAETPDIYCEGWKIIKVYV